MLHVLSILPMSYNGKANNKGTGSVLGYPIMTKNNESHLEARLDAGNRTTGSTRLTLQEEKASVLLQNGVRRATRMTCNILFNVSPQNIFNLLLLESPLDDKLVVSIHRTTSAQLSKQEVQ